MHPETISFTAPRDTLWRRCLRSSATAALLPFLLTGCGRLRPAISEHSVYVTAKQAFLRDRVAAVSNRTGTVSNGDKLVVLEHSRRFLKVRTPRGEVGWLEERLTADQGVADRFEQLRDAHGKDPVIASGTARDEVYMHLSPGRETERFFRLAEGDSLSLLQRATVVKSATPGAAPTAAQPKLLPTRKPVKKKAENPAGQDSAKDSGKDMAVAEPAGPPPPVMEDWWLVRDSRGETGWVYSRMLDVSEPDVLSRYSEGQRIVGAYVLTHVEDPESNMMNNGQPVTSIPEYVTVLSPFKAGLPYDFDQVRVFIWNVKKHRYETGFRQRNIAGYLPVEIAQKTDPYSKQPNALVPLPSFTYHILPADAPMPVPDPATGLVKPSRLIAKTLRLEGNICAASCRRERLPRTKPTRSSKVKGKREKRRR